MYLPLHKLITINVASSAAAAAAIRNTVGRLEVTPAMTPHGTSVLILMETFFVLVLGRRWRRRLPSYVVPLPDLVSAEGLIVGIGQVMVHFLVGGPFQAIGDACMKLKLYPVDAWWLRDPAMRLASAWISPRPDRTEVEPRDCLTEPLTDLELRLARWTPSTLAVGLGCEVWMRALECMPSRS